MRKRIQDGKRISALAGRAAAHVTVKGKYVQRHRKELRRLIDQLTQDASCGPPPHRVIAIREKPRKLSITTDSVHMARKIVEMLQHNFHGEIEYSFGKADRLLRVKWRRD